MTDPMFDWSAITPKLITEGDYIPSRAEQAWLDELAGKIKALPVHGSIAIYDGPMQNMYRTGPKLELFYRKPIGAILRDMVGVGFFLTKRDDVAGATIVERITEAEFRALPGEDA